MKEYEESNFMDGSLMKLDSRIKKVFSSIQQDVDAILITNATEPYIDVNFFYVSGLHKGLFEHCSALIHPDGSGQILVSMLEQESAMNSDLRVTVYQNNEEYSSFLADFLSSKETIGLNNQGILHQDYLKLSKQFPQKSFVDISNALIETRIKKDSTEIQSIRKACDIAERTMKKIPDMISNKMTENELAAQINYYMQRYGADAPAFETIASFADHTAQPHYTHGNRSLQKGDFILCDFGARYQHYNSDITRTFVYDTSSTMQKNIHDTVLRAQQKAIEQIKPGMIAAEIHQMTKEYIDKSQFTGRFIHSTGHSLGLNVHDGGIGLQEHAQNQLQRDMVLTVEPGIYVPGLGGVRIEDDLLITENGCLLLTNPPRELIEI